MQRGMVQMTFSVKHSALQAEKLHIQRCKAQAKSQNPDYKAKHPQECVDANQNQYTLLIKRVKEEHAKFMDNKSKRMIKLGKRI